VIAAHRWVTAPWTSAPHATSPKTEKDVSGLIMAKASQK
jgi:hypothetical protein